MPEPFKPHEPDNHLRRLRAVIATLRFRKTITDYESKGVDFRTHLYVPEIDRITQEPFHERADHCHLLKRIAGKNIVHSIVSW